MKLERIMNSGWVAFIVATLVALAPSVARSAAPTIESELVQQGVAAYNDLEYARAIKLLDQALQETLTLQEKRLTYLTMAFSQFALNRPSETIAAFENLL